MKLGTKVIIAIIATVLFMLVLPLLAMLLFKDESGMGLFFLCFFVVNPLFVIALGIMSGTDLKRLWCVPLTVAVAFPLLFGVAIRDLVLDFYFYSAIYLPISALAMLGTHLAIKIAKK